MLHTAVAPSLPASVVTHTVSGYFLPDSLAAQKAKEVIAIRQNHVTLYKVKAPASSSGQPSSAADNSLDQLGYVADVSLNAPPLAAAVCRPFRAAAELLVLLFDDFHLSFLQYNPFTTEFDTVALVQLDSRQLNLDKCPLEALLRVDSTGTYVAVLAKRSDVFFFPVLELLSPEALSVVQASAAAAAAASADAATDANNSAGGAGAEEAATVTKIAAQAQKVSTVALNAWGDEDEDDNERADEEQNTMEGELPKSGGAAPGEVTEESTTSPGRLAGNPAAVTSAAGSVLLRIGSVTHWRLLAMKPTLRNIRDVQFVESSGEPLLAFLFEKYPTWAGRAKLLEWRSKTVESNMLTCSIEWVKVTLAKSATPQMLSLSEVDGLPYDVTGMTPLPAFQDVPSAVLCVSRNMILHISIKSGYGAYINANGEEQVRNLKASALTFEKVQWRDAVQEISTELAKVNLNFADATAVLVPATSIPASSLRLLLITEEEGTVVEVFLVSHGYTVGSVQVRIVTTGLFAGHTASVDATRFFLGSLNGDSRFVACTARDPCRVLQRFLCIGPVRDMDLVDTTTQPSEKTDTLDPSVEASPYADLYRSVELTPEPPMSAKACGEVMDIALCSGTGTAGSLSVLRRSVRSRVVREQELNAISVFFLEPSAPDSRKRQRDGEANTSSADGAARAGACPHLLITGVNFSFLLAVRSDAVQQVRGATLCATARTVYAAYLDWMPALLQITETELRLLSVDGKRRMGHIDFHLFVFLQSTAPNSASSSTGTPATSAASVLLISDLQCLLIRFTSGHLLHISLSDPRVMANTATPLLTGVAAAAWWAASETLVVIQGMDLVLYSLSNGGKSGPAQKATRQSSFPNFALIPAFAVEGIETQAVKLRERLNAEPLPTVTHLSVFDEHEAPSAAAAPTEATLVMILSSGELVTYRVVPRDTQGPRRCVKQIYHMLDVMPETDVVESVAARKVRLQEERAQLASITQMMRHCSERLIPFQGLQNRYNGFYVCGQTPAFLVYHEASDQLVLSRHHRRSAVRGFTPFHSRLVPRGFVYCGEGYVHFATMQPFGELLANDGWWMERIPLGCTPHKVTYSAAAGGCFVVASRPQPFAPKKAPFDVQLRTTEDEEGNRTSHLMEPVVLQPLSASSGAPVPMNERYEVLFYTSSDWECTDRYLLDENEKVLATSLLPVTRDTTMDATGCPNTAPVCALATAYPLGEDVTSRGRLLLLATSQLDGEAPQLRRLHEEAMKGPVTAITSIGEDCVAVAVGGTVRVYRYKASKSTMETMAILYAGAYVTHLSAFRDYLVIGDLFHSVLFARYSAENHTVTILGRDTSTTSVVFNDMLYHDSHFGLIVADDKRNLACMHYKPRVVEEPGKPPKVLEALLSVSGEYRLAGGSLVKMLRLRAAASNARSSVGVYVTNTGELGFLVPLGDQTSRTGQWVVRRLQSEVPHVAGLAPRMFLGFRQDDPVRSLKGEEWLLHVPLLEQLYRQDLRTRKLIASAAQTQLDRALNVGATVSAELGAF